MVCDLAISASCNDSLYQHNQNKKHTTLGAPTAKTTLMMSRNNLKKMSSLHCSSRNTVGLIREQPATLSQRTPCAKTAQRFCLRHQTLWGICCSWKLLGSSSWRWCLPAQEPWRPFTDTHTHIRSSVNMHTCHAAAPVMIGTACAMNDWTAACQPTLQCSC